MSIVHLALFKNSQTAGQVVSDLKEKGYTKEISVVAYDTDTGKTQVHEVKQDATTGTVAGASIGAIAGALGAIFSGITGVFLPGIGLLIGGPLMAALGISGGIAGSLAGGLVGGLVDLGINEPTADIYDQQLKAGQVLIGVSTDDDESIDDAITHIFIENGATNQTKISH